VLEDSDITAVGSSLVRALEEAKIALSCGADDADISQFNDQTGRYISHTMTRDDLAGLLKKKDLPQLVSGTIHRALEDAQERYGLLPSQLKGVLMVGGSSMLLGVGDIVRTALPNATVHCDRPFEAIAAGACRYAGEDLNPTLVHEYGLYGWNRGSKGYDWVPVIPRGTRYPTEKVITGRYISTAVAESDVLGLVVSERSWMKMPQSDYEVGSDGQLLKVDKGNKIVSGERELNPQAREFIHADPPCGVEEAKRFVVGFGVDRNKRLTVSIKDTRPGNRSYVQLPGGEKEPLPVRDYPLVKL
jgi:molecular chaperone DnaK